MKTSSFGHYFSSKKLNIFRWFKEKRLIFDTFTTHTRSVREGNVFSLSVHRGPRTWYWTMDPPLPHRNLGLDRGTSPANLGLDRGTPPPTGQVIPPPPADLALDRYPPYWNSKDGMTWVVHLWRSRWKSFLFTLIFGAEAVILLSFTLKFRFNTESGINYPSIWNLICLFVWDDQ